MTLNEYLIPQRISTAVRFQTRNIEYVSGLAPTPSGDFIVTYGVNDSEAYVAKVARSLIDDMLCYSFEGPAVLAEKRWNAALNCAAK